MWLACLVIKDISGIETNQSSRVKSMIVRWRSLLSSSSEVRSMTVGVILRLWGQLWYFRTLRVTIMPQERHFRNRFRNSGAGSPGEIVESTCRSCSNIFGEDGAVAAKLRYEWICEVHESNWLPTRLYVCRSGYGEKFHETEWSFETNKSVSRYGTSTKGHTLDVILLHIQSPLHIHSL